MRKKIVNWMRKQLREAEAKGIVMGLSGGVDSSVVAALAKQAVGTRRLLALLLPCHSQKQDLKDAQLVARNLGIRTRTVDLTEIYDKLMGIVPPAGVIAKANLKARLRMLVIYYFANKLNYLVCGTGNKSELSIGYFSKFGDGAADLLPIGDLLKREVKALARGLGVPQQIIAKPPTAGLWPGQTDEGEMGITYPELDDILEHIENKKRQVLPKKKINRVKLMMKKSEHKRQGPKMYLVRSSAQP